MTAGTTDELSRLVHDMLQVGILVVGSDGLVHSCNAWLLDSMGREREDVEGQALLAVVPELADSRLSQCIDEVLLSGRPIVLSQALNRSPLPLRGSYSGGPQVDMEQAITLVRLSTGDGGRYCLVQVNDVTPMVRREKKLRQLNVDARANRKKLENAKADVDQLNEVLENRSRDLETFSHAAAHDLKAPMRHMANLAGMLLEDCAGRLDKEDQRSLQLLDAAGRRGTRVVDDLLAFAQALCPAQLHRVTLDAALDAALLHLQGEVEQRPMTLVRQPLGRVMGLETGLTLVFQNLVANAMKYSGSEPLEVNISSAHKDGYVEVRVADNGVGVPDSQLEAIFEAFRRGHHEAIAGSGIGLATCRRIIEECGGTIWAESLPQGAVFAFRCPEADSRRRIDANLPVARTG